MAGSAFDLDQFAPADVTFAQTRKKVTRTYRLNGDPDVDVVARMLRIEDAIRDAEGIDATVVAIQEAKKLIVELIHDTDDSQDVSELKLNTQDVMTLFALVLHGSSVASVVAQAISQPGQGDDDDENGVATPGSGHDEEHWDADATPLVSASTSSERSSTSADIDDGPPVTGTA